MQLGPYRLERPLRDAQVGQAFIARKRGPDGFQKPVIIRCTARETLGALVAEANRAARLSHAGIAHVLDVGAFEDLGYVVSEHAHGVTLRDVVQQRGRLPWAWAARIVSDTAAALSYAHARRDEEGRLLGIVHRRITPRRITLSLHGPGQDLVVGLRSKLTGMGTSWAWPDAQGFGAPEEMRGEPIDGRADVFSLGVVLARIVDRDGAGRLDAIVRRATEPVQEVRYTARELEEALRRALRDTVLVDRGAPRNGMRSLRR